MSLALKQSDRVCIPVPLAHPFGFGGALSVLMAGGTLVLPASTDPSLLVCPRPSNRRSVVCLCLPRWEPLDNARPQLAAPPPRRAPPEQQSKHSL